MQILVLTAPQKWVKVWRASWHLKPMSNKMCGIWYMRNVLCFFRFMVKFRKLFSSEKNFDNFQNHINSYSHKCVLKIEMWSTLVDLKLVISSVNPKFIQIKVYIHSWDVLKTSWHKHMFFLYLNPLHLPDFYFTLLYFTEWYICIVCH